MGDRYSIIVFGASGDLAKKKTYPALFNLFLYEYLPKETIVAGYARSALTNEEFRGKMKEAIMKEYENVVNEKLEQFINQCFYIQGVYDSPESYMKLQSFLCRGEDKRSVVRVYYMATPPSVFTKVARGIKEQLMQTQDNVFHRIIVEKPFGKDSESSGQLQKSLSKLFEEKQVFRIDHYLGKEMVKNILVLRFANMLFSAIWNRNCIDNVQITFKETLGIEGRGSYFDEFGIIRDVMQNHLLQILTLIAMERPVNLDPESIRDEKTKVLKCIRPIELDQVVLGQYNGYTQDSTVPKNSRTPTYAAAALYINNERWDGVPFIMKCGKAVDTKKTEIRIQFKNCPAGSVFFDGQGLARNELVMRVSPTEAVYLKMMNKQPGIEFDTVVSELDLTYKYRYSEIHIPEAYESLILDVLRNDHGNFVRSDELEAAWRIFTPLLHRIDSENISPEIYDMGSRGPSSADELLKKNGYVISPKTYNWKPQS